LRPLQKTEKKTELGMNRAAEPYKAMVIYHGPKLIEICLDLARLKNSLVSSIPKLLTCIDWAAQAIKCN
jgi:hypothetical protein